MFYDNELQFLQKLLDKCHLPYAIINPDSSIDDYDYIPFRHILRYRRFSDAFYSILSDRKPATIYRLINVYLCRYIFLELPHSEQPTLLLIGPYLSNNITHHQILEQAELLATPPSNVRELELFFSSVPVVRDEHHLFAMINTFAEYVFNGEGNYSSVDLYWDYKAAPLPDFTRNSSDESDGLDAAVMENRYQFENNLMDAVSQGNAHKAEMMMAGFSSLTFENRTSDQLRNMKNYCIIMNTLMRKAAEKGCVHPIHLDWTSSGFARRIEELRTLNGVSDFMLEMMRAYCRLVKHHSVQKFSPLVQRAMIQIEGDLTGDLSLRTIAAKNNVSPGYLSALFKKETGQVFTAYVNGRRIAMAKHLLETTHLQIQTIAQHCGILDFHYFCRLFKNAVGITPTAYRAKRIYE